MQRATGRRRAQGTKQALRVGVLLAAVVALLGINIQAANAFVLRGVTGYPGTSTVPKTVGTENCSLTLCVPIIQAPGRTIYESTRYSSSWQYVCLTQRFYFDGGYAYGSAGQWQRAGTLQTCKWISPAATGAAFGGAYIETANSGFSGDFATDFRVTWQLQSGTTIGTKTYDYVNTGDYRCASYRLSFGATCQVVANAVGNEAGIRIIYG